MWVGKSKFEGVTEKVATPEWLKENQKQRELYPTSHF